MTRAETAQILAVLKAAYPHSFKGMTRVDAEAMLNLWARQFESDNPKAVAAAVDALIATRQEGFSPTVGEVKAQLQRLKDQGGMSESAAWALVSKACQNGLYGYKEEFAKLPEEVQRVVGEPEQLKAWAMMDGETVESVVASNFMKNFRTNQKREKENAMLPTEVREMLTAVSSSMTIEKKEERKPKMLPVPLEPMKPFERPKLVIQEQKEEKAEYKAPDPESWEKKREEAMRKLGVK